MRWYDWLTATVIALVLGVLIASCLPKRAECGMGCAPIPCFRNGTCPSNCTCQLENDMMGVCG